MSSFLKKEGVDYLTNFYRYTCYDRKDQLYLITVDDGNFLFTNKSTFQQLKRGRIEDNIVFEKLLEKGIIITDENFNTVVEKTKKRYEFLMNGTSLHIVVPTTRCNQDCPYCFASPEGIGEASEESDMDEETALKTIDFIMQSPSYAITIEFTGGEALARFDLVQKMVLHAHILNKIAKKNLRLTLVTNLTMANEKMLSWLIDHGVTLCTSLDGPKNIHDENRIIMAAQGRKVGTYDRVIHWIDWINEYYKKKELPHKLMALMTITRTSLKHHKEIIDEYVRLGMEVVDIRALTMVGDVLEGEGQNLWYSKEEFVEFYKKSISYIDKLRSQEVDIDDRMRQLYEKKILENIPTYHTDFESPWGAAIGGLTYGPKGAIYACHEALGQREFNLGSVHTDSWNSLFKKPETSFVVMSSMLENNVICDRCVYKPYCGTLPVENFSQFRKFNFYPARTSRHHETLFHARQVFDKIRKKIM